MINNRKYDASTFISNIVYEFTKNIKQAKDLSLNIDNAASLPTLACIKWGLQTQRVFGNNVCMTIKYTQSNATQRI